jgi:hypothetical protein
MRSKHMRILHPQGAVATPNKNKLISISIGPRPCLKGKARPGMTNRPCRKSFYKWFPGLKVDMAFVQTSWKGPCTLSIEHTVR